MNKLRIISLIILALVGLAGFISHPCVALSELPRASIEKVTLTTYEKGGYKKIAFNVKICVEKDSPVPLKGFHMCLTLIDPNGHPMGLVKPSKDTIEPGQCKDYYIPTAFKADKVGTWKYKVMLYTAKCEVCLDEKIGFFEVRESGVIVMLPAQVPKASIVEAKPTTYEEGGHKKIAFNVKICVEKDSPVPLKGFTVVAEIKRPGESDLLLSWYVNNTIIYQGQCKAFYIKTPVKVDRTGIWTYSVRLYTKDKQHVLDVKPGTFKVSEGGIIIPNLAKDIETLKIVSYAVTSLVICAGLALILSRIIR